jgi:hypothetical protein
MAEVVLDVDLIPSVYEVLLESSQTVIVVTASVKEDESVGQGHVSADYCISLPCETRCEHTLFLHECFSTSCFVFLSAMDGKIEQHVCIKFCVKLDKSATKTLEMYCEAFGEHSLSWTAVFEWHSHFKAGQVSVEYDERSG